MANDFKNYQLNTLERKPRDQLVSFINSHLQEINNGTIKNAVDLGCGGCVDTKYLASLGLNVFAVDKNIHNEVMNYIKESTAQNQFENISFSQQGFENLNLPKTDLFWSFASMPFCQKESFGQMIANIVSSINPNGYFVGHFFDKTHPFITEGGNVGVDKEQMQQLFDYLGFKADVSTFQSERTLDGRYTENLNNVFVVAQAPEQLKDFTVDQINNILGLNPQQENNNSILENEQAENTESNYNLNETENLTENSSLDAPSQPDWMSKVGDGIREKLSTPTQQDSITATVPEPQPLPPPPPEPTQ